MYDMYVAEAIIDNDYQEYAKPEKKEALINEVLKKHKISEARWDTSLSWYSDKIDVYLQLNDSVKARLSRDQATIETLITQQNNREGIDEIKPADYIPSQVRISLSDFERGFNFSLDSIQSNERFINNSDSILFSFKIIGISQFDKYSLKSYLRLNYSDSTIFITENLTQNKLYELPIDNSIDTLRISSIDGFIYLNGKLPHTPIQIYDIKLSARDTVSVVDNSVDIDNNIINEETIIDKAQPIE